MVSVDDLQFGCELEFYVNQMIEEERKLMSSVEGKFDRNCAAAELSSH